MSMLLAILAATGAAAPDAEPARPSPSAKQECRRAGSPNGARIGRSVCKSVAEWTAQDRDRGAGFRTGGKFPSLNPGPGDNSNRTASRTAIYAGNKGASAR